MTTSRLEAFSDGVLAIIITIMVLELHVAGGADAGTRSGTTSGPVLLTYLLSFVYIGIYWNNHHHMFQLADRVSGAVLWANLRLLFLLSLYPFTTAWMNESTTSARHTPSSSTASTCWRRPSPTTSCSWPSSAAEGADSKLREAVGSDLKGKLSPVLYILGIASAASDPPARRDRLLRRGGDHLAGSRPAARAVRHPARRLAPARRPRSASSRRSGPASTGTGTGGPNSPCCSSARASAVGISASANSSGMEQAGARRTGDVPAVDGDLDGGQPGDGADRHRPAADLDGRCGRSRPGAEQVARLGLERRDPLLQRGGCGAVQADRRRRRPRRRRRASPPCARAGRRGATGRRAWAGRGAPA